MWILLLAATALGAEGWGKPRPFIQPILGGGVVTVGNTTVGQVTGGVAGGFNIAYRTESVKFVDTTRAYVTGTYGIGSGSLGADVGVGSFFGPDFKVLRLQAGPEVFFNGYGDPNAIDYHLAWSPGLALVGLGTLTVVPKVLTVHGDVAPGWVFNSARQSGAVSPFSEMTAGASVSLNAGPVGIRPGLRRYWNAAGEYTVYSLGFGI